MLYMIYHPTFCLNLADISFFSPSTIMILKFGKFIFYAILKYIFQDFLQFQRIDQKTQPDNTVMLCIFNKKIENSEAAQNSQIKKIDLYNNEKK